MTDEKQAQKKRIMWVLGVGFLSLIMFFYLANGVTSLLADASVMDPVEQEPTDAH